MSSAQARLNRLLPQRAKAIETAGESPAFFEKEIADYASEQEKARQRLHAPAQPAHAVQASQGQKDNINEQEGDQGVATHEPTFIPGGIQKGGKAISSNSARHNMTEPQSSSRNATGSFCVWAVVAKFPYKYMYDPTNEVSARFFSANKIFRRNWTLHYIYGPASSSAKPLILVPTTEFQNLLDDIQKTLKINVEVPPYPFQITFAKDGTPLPHVLGKMNSKEDFTNLVGSLASESAQQASLSANASLTMIKDFKAWSQKIEDALGMEKKSKKSGAQKKARNAEFAAADDANQLKRAQEYLGLRRRVDTEVVREGTDDNAAVKCDPIGTPPPDQPVLIAFDVEAYERDHSVITEIGVSTLDTASLQGPPGDRAENWLKHIRSRHFRIQGREQLRNTTFMHGDPDAFYFGVSEFVSPQEAPDAVDGCFEAPHSAGFECFGPAPVDDTGIPIPRTLATLDTSKVDADAPPRDIVILGHDVAGDIDYLEQLGSAIFSAPGKIDTPDRAARRRRVVSTIREVLDTSTLYRTLTKALQPKGLGKMCAELDIDAWQLHNAGNDARYTLEAFVKLSIKASEQKEEPVAHPTSDPVIQPASKREIVLPTNLVQDQGVADESDDQQSVTGQTKDEEDDDDYPY